MASSLLDSLTSLAKPELVNTVAERLGEQPQAVSHGLTAGFGAILASLVSKATDSGGLKQIFDLVTGSQGVSQLTNDPAELATAALGATSSTTSSGLQGLIQQFLSSSLSGSMGSVTNVIAQATGLRASSASSLLSVAAPMIMGVLGNRVRDQGLSPASLGNLLMAEKDSILRAAPAGLGGLMGLTDTAREAAGRMVDSLPGTNPQKRGGMTWLIWLVIAALLAFFAFSRCQRNRMDTSTLSNAADTLATRGESLGTNIVDAAKSATARLGAFVNRTLPGGTTLNVPENGIESRLIAFITDKNQPVSDTVWFDFDRLLFETGSSKLTPESSEQLQNIASILKAYPNVNIKLGGYTDNQGDPKANLALSQSRADYVRQQLIGLGIAENRITAEGYGDAHPVADNGTEEGRAKNRRIALRVTQK